MGLDSVEIVMEVEDEFDITITDDEAAAIRHVGELVDCVCSKAGKCPRKPRQGCASARTFYRLRAALVAHLGLSPRDIRPATVLAGIIPRHRRRDVWNALRADDLALPPLHRPRNVVALSATVVLLIAAAVAAAGYNISGANVAAFAGLLCGAVAAYAASRLSAPWATEIPELSGRVQDAALWATRVPSGELTRGEISFKVRQIIAEQMGLTMSSVTEDKNFVGDLGV